MSIDRRQPKLAMERHDFITVEQCAKLVIAYMEREFARRDEVARQARERTWYRRLRRWWERPVQW